MPSNKNASMRYRIIDSLLRGGKRKYTIKELLDRVNEILQDSALNPVSESTLRHDIGFMRRDEMDGGFGAPIVCKDGKYFYEDTDYSIRNAPLNPDDIENLHAAWEFLRGIADLPLVKLVEDALKKLEDTAWMTKMDPLIQFDFPFQVLGMEHIMPLLQAIKDEIQVIIDYHPFNKPRIDNLLCNPWILKEFNGRWFLVAQSPLRQGISLFALDRIKKLVVSDKPAAAPSVNLSEKFSQAVGLSIPDDAMVEEVVLRFTPPRVRYVLSKPIHASQEVLEETKDYVKIRIKVIITRELISLIHYFGADVVVEAPGHLREKIKQDLNHLLSAYT
ncbi:MAG: helix-turn-helix transcriptional regulator [Bacteroidales bacterium]